MPFNLFGGPQVSEHHCGPGHYPRRVRYMVAASGTGYMAYEFPPEERVETRFTLWISYWSHCILPGLAR